MSEATETVQTLKTASDGSVKIAVEKYNELLEEIANNKGTISNLRSQLTRALNEPPVINRTIINKTPEMAARENLMWGNTFIGLGVCFLGLGVIRRRAGLAQS